MSEPVPVPPSRPPLWSPRGPAVPQLAPTGAPIADTGRRPRNWQYWDDRVAIPPWPDIPSLQVTSVTAGEVSTVTVSGEIDCFTAPGLQEVLDDVLHRSPPPSCVVVDLRQVTFLGAVGLRALAGGHRLAESLGGVLRIRCGSARAVVRPLQVTGLWDVLHVIEREVAGDGC